MAKRRAATEGTIFQAANGRWVVMVELPRGLDGKRRRRKRWAATQAEAQRILRTLKKELDAGGISSVQRTVGESVADFRVARASKDVTTGTLEQDEWQLRLIEVGLGRQRISSLSVLECDQFLVEAAMGLRDRRPIGRDQMSRLRSLLISVVRNEMRLGHIVRNVAELSILPSELEDAGERRALTVDELRSLLEAAKGSRLIIVDFCGRNGLRPAEARAVRWSDIDLDRSELSVTGQMDRHNERTDPKTRKSSRTIRLDRSSVDRLGAWQEEQQEMRATARDAWNLLDIVASTATGMPIDRHSLARSMRKLCKRTGITPHVTPYELRHTAISLQADAGRSSWEIADWAGTSEAMISHVYRHRLHRVASLMAIDESGTA